jgi:type I restriction enzyme, S subunit
VSSYSKLPLSALGELVEPIETWDPSRAPSNELFSYIDLSAIDQDSKRIVGARQTLCGEAPSRARQLIAKGDVLISTVRPNLNAVARVPDEFHEATASTGFCVLRPNIRKVDGGYLFHWVKSPQFIREMVNKATGASYPAVSDRIIFNAQIPLPNLASQRRIADILDHAEALRAKRRAALAELDTLTQCIFLDMFGDPVTNPNGWSVVRLGEHAIKIGSGSTPTGGESAYKAEGISLIRSLNVRDGEFAFKDLAFIDDNQAEKLSGVIVEEDDVLLNITGASVARVCRAPATVLPARVNQHVCIIRPKPSFNAVFLEQLLLVPQTKRRLLKIAGIGATREAITKGQIEQFETIGPPMDQQCEFARRVGAVENVKAAQRKSSAGLDALFSCLQHRAFRGEL